jgi:hypothetical protein
MHDLDFRLHRKSGPQGGVGRDVAGHSFQTGKPCCQPSRTQAPSDVVLHPTPHPPAPHTGPTRAKLTKKAPKQAKRIIGSAPNGLDPRGSNWRREYCSSALIQAAAGLRAYHLILKGNAFGIVFRKPGCCRLKFCEELEVVGVSNLLARIHVYQHTHGDPRLRWKRSWITRARNARTAYFPDALGARSKKLTYDLW